MRLGGRGVVVARAVRCCVNSQWQAMAIHALKCDVVAAQTAHQCVHAAGQLVCVWPHQKQVDRVMHTMHASITDIFP